MPRQYIYLRKGTGKDGKSEGNRHSQPLENFFAKAVRDAPGQCMNRILLLLPSLEPDDAHLAMHVLTYTD